MFALRPETSLRIYTYAPDRHSLPVRQTLPPVRKTETEEKTVRRLLLQIPARLRKVLTIINCGEATLLPPRFLFFNPSSQTKTYKLFPSSRAQRGDPEERCANVYANYPVVWQRDCRGRFAPSQRRSFYSVIASAAWRSRRLAYARLLYFFTQIVPLRVYGLDKFYFLCPTARFNRFFGSQRLFYGRKNFVIYATRNVITIRKTFNLMFSMLLDSPVQIARNPPYIRPFFFRSSICIRST